MLVSDFSRHGVIVVQSGESREKLDNEGALSREKTVQTKTEVTAETTWSSSDKEKGNWSTLKRLLEGLGDRIRWIP
jgi:hypothetical protein